jgi:ABC-type nitrate/sulfonate/bicarbonate transport system substrate-binding protein
MIRRRTFVNMALAAGAAGVLGPTRAGFAAEPPPETTRIRLNRYPFDVACLAPQWVAEELLRAEGFETVEYLSDKGDTDPLAKGTIDVSFYDAPGLILAVAERHPVVGLGACTGAATSCSAVLACTRSRNCAVERSRCGTRAVTPSLPPW